MTPFAVAIVGPTASGKTAVSLPFSERFGGEILCCDSMQIYRGMDIGTAKATPEERARVPHHLLDLCDPDEPFCAADYAETALEKVRGVTARGKLPVFVGGTGLYLEAARTGRHANPAGADPAFRAEMQALAARSGNEEVHRLLTERDPEAAAAIHPNNLRRVIRALEIARTGKTKTELDEASRELPPAIEMCILYLTYEDRDLLYRRIDARVDEMFRAGLVAEVEGLLKRGYLDPGTTAGQAIGYKEVAAILRAGGDAETARDAVAQATRRYAKRQQTWFSAVRGAHRVVMDRDGKNRRTEEVLAEISEIVQKFVNNT